MSAWGQVSARRLHRRRVQLRDATLRTASLFPFFSGDGRVRTYMLVWPGKAHIVLMERDPGLFRVPLLGKIRMRSELRDLADTTAQRAAAVTAGCWHYDPWWLLREQRFDGHPAVPILAATNCVEQFREPVSACYFSRDLANLQAFDLANPASMYQGAVPFSSNDLPDRSPAIRSLSPAKGWRLDPFWQRKKPDSA